MLNEVQPLAVAEVPLVLARADEAVDVPQEEELAHGPLHGVPEQHDEVPQEVAPPGVRVRHAPVLVHEVLAIPPLVTAELRHDLLSKGGAAGLLDPDEVHHRSRVAPAESRPLSGARRGARVRLRLGGAAGDVRGCGGRAAGGSCVCRPARRRAAPGSSTRWRSWPGPSAPPSWSEGRTPRRPQGEPGWARCSCSWSLSSPRTSPSAAS
mmetsp:Transcript_106561/g.333325  ORF Transcript_106561/g.333325 Transcript_106561/m.333325 type:complete len:209 (-) Transcript_106561:392-1018(-)